MKSYVPCEATQCQEPNPSVGPWAHYIPQVLVSLSSRLLDTVQLCNHDQVIEKGWTRRNCSKPLWHLFCFTWEQHFHARHSVWVMARVRLQLCCPGPWAQTSHMASRLPDHWRLAWPLGTLVSIPIPAFLSCSDTLGLCSSARFCSADVPHPWLPASCPTSAAPDIKDFVQVLGFVCLF